MFSSRSKLIPLAGSALPLPGLGGEETPRAQHPRSYPGERHWAPLHKPSCEPPSQSCHPARYHQMFLFSPVNIILILMQARAEVCRSVGFNQHWDSLHRVAFSLSCWNDTVCSVRVCRASHPAAWEGTPGCGLWLGAAPTSGRGARCCTSLGRSRQSAGSALTAVCSAASSPYLMLQHRCTS